MIEPLQGSLVSAVLECINQDRMGNGHMVNSEVVRGVIESFVAVNKFKKRDNIEVILPSANEVLIFYVLISKVCYRCSCIKRY